MCFIPSSNTNFQLIFSGLYFVPNSLMNNSVTVRSKLVYLGENVFSCFTLRTNIDLCNAAVWKD